ncbi:hypothetical protein THRCLA_21972 [Thraustotheca clavata]|uniref:DUF4203 domain-containing protein n=1 Tax=Thraustotheca clavata TaxID=74557 RepID=A0A1V9ZGC2_9STRA|nr:hypothetical protein THRCLA_21972 [Thraustotheca clavata]
MFPLPSDTSSMDPLDVLLYLVSVSYGVLCIFAGYRRLEIVIVGLPALFAITIVCITDCPRLTGIAIALFVLIASFFAYPHLLRKYRDQYFVTGIIFLYIATIGLLVDSAIDFIHPFTPLVQLVLYICVTSIFVVYFRCLTNAAISSRLIHSTAIFGTLVVIEIFTRSQKESLAQNILTHCICAIAGIVFGIWYQTKKLPENNRASMCVTEVSEITTPRPEMDEWVAMPYVEVLIQDEADVSAMEKASKQ